MKDKPFTLLGVNSDSAEHYKKAIKDKNITWPSFWDGGTTSGPIATHWAVQSWPTIYIIDAQGIICHKNLHGEAMDKAVDALLKEMEGN